MKWLRTIQHAVAAIKYSDIRNQVVIAFTKTTVADRVTRLFFPAR